MAVHNVQSVFVVKLVPNRNQFLNLSTFRLPNKEIRLDKKLAAMAVFFDRLHAHAAESHSNHFAKNKFSLTTVGKGQTFRTMAVSNFPHDIGSIIHGCGMLELMTNSVIERLATDSILSREVVQLTFGRRIKILRKLLHDRTSMPDGDVDKFCDELSKIAQDRNAIAHNPIVSQDPSGKKEAILIIRHKFDPPQIKKVTETDLQRLAKRINAVMKMFHPLLNFVPGKTFPEN